jgi:hypothetical protein
LNTNKFLLSACALRGKFIVAIYSPFFALAEKGAGGMSTLDKGTLNFLPYYLES